MNGNESRAYSRGYSAGRRGAWPDHRPPVPPSPIIAKVLEAAKSLRDAVDGELATLEQDDRWQTIFGNPVDEFDQAMIEFGEWVRAESEQTQ